MKQVKEEKKSPVSQKHLRYAGQSLDKEIENLITSKLLMVFIGVTAFFIASLNDWIYYYFQQIPNPLFTSIVFLIALGWGIYTIIKLKKELKYKQQGLDGEKEVGYILEELRENGVKVYHDMIGGDFNLDHILICEKGIFVIETKTWSKPMSGKANIIVDGENLIFNGENRGGKPIIQAKAGANWLKNFLKETTSREFQVNPIVLFLGWYIETPIKNQKDIWVFHPKGFDSYFRKYLEFTPQIYTKEDIAMISYRIREYIKAN